MLAIPIGNNGQRSAAEPGWIGHCPACRGDVIARCGQVNVWHWAHKQRDCDTWAEPETQWHTDWQGLFPADNCEVLVGSHRADVRTPAGLVIEFQHCSLSVNEIHEREDHYGSMLWVFDAIEAIETDRLNLRLGRHRDCGENRLYRSFRWKHPRRSILYCRRPTFLDLGNGWLFQLKRMSSEAPYGGWGYLYTVDAFLSWCGL